MENSASIEVAVWVAATVAQCVGQMERFVAQAGVHLALVKREELLGSPGVVNVQIPLTLGVRQDGVVVNPLQSQQGRADPAVRVVSSRSHIDKLCSSSALAALI